jgi:DNA-binding NtrC family response regulator
MSRVLIVESEPGLGQAWKRHLEAEHVRVSLARGQQEAVTQLLLYEFDVIVLDLFLAEGSALAVSDFASYRQPGAQVIVVSGGPLFADGSIFRHCSNARAMMRTDAPVEDLAAMVEHFAVH